MEKIKVLMLDLKSYYPSPAYQLGLLAAYASLEEEVKNNVKFTFTEHPREQRAEENVKTILASEADLVCASNYAWNYLKICEILDCLAASQAELPRFLLGGPNSAGTFGEEVMKRYPAVSAMVEGEGEPAFRDICASLVDSPSKDPFLDSRNCLVRAPDGNVTRTKMGHRIEYLDDVPSPYLTGIIPAQPSPLFYETNRGCPYRCSFCYWGNGNSRVYRMSHERIREEMELFASHKVYAFWLADANFGLFPDDAEIAEMMVEISSHYRYPFKNVGVNWAKNSSDRVLEIAGILKKGRMTCTTTLALQSVTPDAKEKSRRYSMAPAKFINLIRSAEEKDIDTYTDIIWALPGESVEEYLDGLDAVISSGVPSILIHQLFLLPGTEFFDHREKYGFTLLHETSETILNPDERSDYWDYIVVSHAKMSRDDMVRGTRILGISHFMHNHDLGKVVDFYLARYSIAHRDVYNFFDDLLLGKIKDFPEEKHEFLHKIRNLILTFANNIGLDEIHFYRQLSEVVWLKKVENAMPVYHEPEVRAFMHEFYQAFCRRHDICQTPEEGEILSEFVDYNVLISPKPSWKPAPDYTFNYDVHAICQDMRAQILFVNGETESLEPARGNGAASHAHGSATIQITGFKKERERTSNKQAAAGSGQPATPAGVASKETWADLSRNVRARLAKLLSREYLATKRGPVTYQIKNPWMIPPSHKTLDWLLGNRSKHCPVSVVAPVREESCQTPRVGASV